MPIYFQMQCVHYKGFFGWVLERKKIPIIVKNITVCIKHNRWIEVENNYCRKKRVEPPLVKKIAPPRKSRFSHDQQKRYVYLYRKYSHKTTIDTTEEERVEMRELQVKYIYFYRMFRHFKSHPQQFILTLYHIRTFLDFWGAFENRKLNFTVAMIRCLHVNQKRGKIVLKTW